MNSIRLVTIPMEERYRDAIGAKIGDGTGDIMKLIIARELIDPKLRPMM